MLFSRMRLVTLVVSVVAVLTVSGCVSNAPQTNNQYAPSVAFNYTQPLPVVLFYNTDCDSCAQPADAIMDVLHAYADAGLVHVRTLNASFSDNESAVYTSMKGALCAAEQDRFWPWYATLYTNYSAVTADTVTAAAQDTGMALANFARCLESGDAENHAMSLIRAYNGTHGYALQLQLTALPGHGISVTSLNQSIRQTLRCQHSKYEIQDAQWHNQSNTLSITLRNTGRNALPEVHTFVFHNGEMISREQFSIPYGKTRTVNISGLEQRPDHISTRSSRCSHLTAGTGTL